MTMVDGYTLSGGSQPEMSQDELRQLLSSVGWPSDQIDNALTVIAGQSGGDPYAIGYNYAAGQNPDQPNARGVTQQSTYTPDAGIPAGAWSNYDTGLFQIDSVHNGTYPQSAYDPHWVRQMEDPQTNAAYALTLFEQQGWGPWGGTPTPGAATNSSVPSAGGSASSGSAPTAGFLHTLQSILNPTLENGSFLFEGILSWTGLGKITDPKNWLIIGEALVARSLVCGVGLFTAAFGLAILVVEGATSDTASGIVGNVGRVQRFMQAPQRLALQQAAAERSAQRLADEGTKREHQLNLANLTSERQSARAEAQEKGRQHRETLSQEIGLRQVATHAERDVKRQHEASQQAAKHAEARKVRAHRSRLANQEHRIKQENADTRAAAEGRRQREERRKRGIL